jgi:hypothetical protein
MRNVSQAIYDVYLRDPEAATDYGSSQSGFTKIVLVLVIENRKFVKHYTI